jgi:DNA-binding beta-propeller fold protein YncE
MRVTRSAVLLVASLCLTGMLHAQSDATLLALSKRDHTLAIVDPVSLKVIAKMPVGDDPHEVIASTDGKTAYVSNYGFGAFHTLAVLDLVNHKALPSIDLGPLRGPHGLTFVGGKTWFTAEAAKAISRYDPATNKVDWILGTGQNRTHMIYVAPDMKLILTTNVNSGTVSIIEPMALPRPPAALPGEPMPRTDWNETVVKVGNGSEGFDISPDGKEVWVANAQDGTISVIALQTKTVVDTLDADVHGANRLKFTVDGKRVLVSTLGGADLVILDAATRKVVKRLPIGHGAAGILMQPDGARAYVACTPDNYIAVVDLHTWEVVGHIESGGGPDGLAWAVR